MKITLLLCVLACGIVGANARTVRVADYGITPGKDVTYAVLELIRSLRNEPDVTLLFSEGRYDFHPANALERYRAVANHDNGLKRIAFPLSNNKNLTIDGGGALFLFHGHMIPFDAEGAEGLTLKNLQIDWARSFHDEMKVVESDPEKKSFTVEIDPERSPYRIRDGKLFFQRYELEIPMGMNMVFDPKTQAPIHGASAYRVNGETMTVSEAGKNRIKFENAVRKAPPAGSVLVAYGDNPTSRISPAIHIANSREVKIENVTVFDAGGMGLIVERTENVSLGGMVVTSGEGRIVSTRADATHFLGCKGTIREENCRFEHMLDDGVNVHGAYVKVTDYLGKNRFLCELSHPQQWGLVFAEPGDRVALLSRETLRPFHETVVKAVDVLNEQRFVMTVEAVPEQLPQGPMSAENLTWYPDLVLKNNTIRQNRGRSVLVTTKGRVLIEGNQFSSSMHGVLIEGDNNKWYESGAVRDVTIRNNVFDNVGFGVTKGYPLKASPVYATGQRGDESPYHRNIRFVGNTIKSFNGLVADAQSVEGLDISGNKVEFSKKYPAASDGPAINLESCHELVITNNQMTGFGEPLAIQMVPDPVRVSVESNPGFEAK